MYLLLPGSAPTQATGGEFYSGDTGILTPALTPSLGPPESPFGPPAGFWGFYGTDIAEVTFTQPVATIDLVYIATMDLLLEAFDADGNLLMSALGPANFPEAAGSWDPMEVQVPRDSIASVRYLKFA